MADYELDNFMPTEEEQRLADIYDKAYNLFIKSDTSLLADALEYILAAYQDAVSYNHSIIKEVDIPF